MIGRGGFVERVASKGASCSECPTYINPGATEFVSMKKGKVMKRVCSQDCVDTFDDRFWRAKATERIVRQKHGHRA